MRKSELTVCVSIHELPLTISIRVAETLNTSPAGLDSTTATKLAEEHGKNILEVKKKKSVWYMLWKQLTDFMILVLIAAAVVSGIVGDLTDTIVILAIVIINAIVGLVQEWRAEKAMEALREHGCESSSRATR